MSEPAIDIEGFSYAYGEHQALRNVHLSVPSGSLFGLLGPNGGGKTTLFRALSTLIRPPAGAVKAFGFDVRTHPSAVRERLGVVFQHIALDQDLTVTENLRYHAALYGVSGKAAQPRTAALLDAFGLTERAGDRVKTLSGGLQRRVDLVRALLNRPSLLLLDEPTNGLDPAARHTFWQTLGRVRREEGTTMLLATHLMDEAERCDEVAIINRGEIVATGVPDALKAELGGETLWIECEDPVALREEIFAHFGFSATVAAGSLQIARPDAPALLASLYEMFGNQIESATIRKPTLEDVFMVRTGNRLGEEISAAAHVLGGAA